ncbi:hypothetical protein D3C81_1172140 [compost metagenome]
MDQLQLAAETENRGTQRVEAADVVKSSPATVTYTYRVKNCGLLRRHSHSAEIPG